MLEDAAPSAVEEPDAEAPSEDAVPAPEGEATAEEPEAEKAAEGGDKAAEGDDKAEADAKVPDSDEDAVETATALLDAIQGKEWPLAIGLLLTLLVYGANKFARNHMVSAKAVPFVAGGVGFAGATGVGLVTGEPLVDAVVAGGLAAVAAVGGWEAIAKLVDKKPEEAAKPEPEETDPGT
jgi:hypothetical protein